MVFFASFRAIIVSGGDKFGNIFVARLPKDVSEDVDDDPTGSKIKWDQPFLNGSSFARIPFFRICWIRVFDCRGRAFVFFCFVVQNPKFPDDEYFSKGRLTRWRR